MSKKSKIALVVLIIVLLAIGYYLRPSGSSANPAPQPAAAAVPPGVSALSPSFSPAALVQSADQASFELPGTSGLTDVHGPMSKLSGRSFTVAANSVHYSVSLAEGAKTLDKNGKTIDFTQVKNGDTVSVWGIFSNFKSAVKIFQDRSIPRG